MTQAKIPISHTTNNGMPYIGVDTPAGGLNLLWSPKNGTIEVAADVLAIPVTHARVSKTTGGNAEALTLANGLPGQVLTIALDTDGGGTGTLTPTTCSGFVSIAFADVGDHATLRYVDDTIGWVIMGASGAAAPPVIALS